MKINKIMIFGRPGSGKTYFSLKLHAITRIPIYHLDKFFFTANWGKRNYDEFMKIQQDIVNKHTWIVDGNCTKSLETRYSQADLCLYFNFPKALCLWRIVKRLFQKRDHIEDRADDCPEAVRWVLIKYMWSFETRIKDDIEKLRIKYPLVTFVEVKNDEQLNSILKLIINGKV
jgi:adenylate kinase family enzyme